ncbi:MAG: 50S ribosomal protein L21 [Candidatus Kerfeldbacteria bacterium RIFOXYA2_FULL_38_24]|uniref:Large ribosomal subunit protein bL21 n=1 Tax=Candidatus Kerfeldbacteria bacterium RIFOXYB2_FULL_38_14 TaxID=1798547 RepID=A0A1G2BHQ9_9BACT|nr:MAG: 50S ribosomal protein L21 [Candidatus Kerfeldbacteria bacterium RIFOXYB2_FULL_38_14]OGY87947.1 MAG: 50S ribosomal protein L21 [Candidatus Kerfeldbacteria bacterium RIFOXYA2_FULL_38_24]OGY88641.1 MAG: 50S ribosomal protein L21 [Candidatus Kerfeldbacteria bacterium RIFOXYC2_FULL_38_9]
MIAVIKTGGKQYKIKEGDLLKVEKIDSAGVGKNIILKEVLLVSEEDGKNLKVGTPYVASAKVEAKVLKQDRARKIVVKKFKAKVRYSRTYGHRQPFTQLEVVKISV